ncbi:hypothetical protein PF007_g25558 [Phytophthora fragariae]|uniref:Uncharacterized protein n=2 Tax=Phytophthora fragariae TaxID=53985 RepID=A0A6A3QF37_9STRA|nr:hypothetical protein PF007_g25558 [Phytophthora fragariae]
MFDGDDAMVLLLYEAYKTHSELVRVARRDVHNLLLEEEWRIAMRARHYLTTQCLDVPCPSSWMTLFDCGTDINFLSATSLTRVVARSTSYCVDFPVTTTWRRYQREGAR